MSLFKREFQALYNDPWQLALTTYVPLFFMLSLWWVFSAALPERLPVAVVDYDHTHLSRELTRHVNASPSIQVIAFSKAADAQHAMKTGEVFAIVTFPYNLKVDLLTKKQPTIDIRYNTQFLLVGKLLAGKIKQSMGDELHLISKTKQMLLGANIHQAAINVSPINKQVTPLYNPNNNYVAFLIPPMLFALLQLIAALAFINSLNHELRQKTMNFWRDNGVWKVLSVKITLYTSIMLLHGAFIYSLIYKLIGINNNGAVSTLLFALFVMLLSIWLIVLFLFFFLKDGVRVTSMASAILAPAFGFMGVTFPVANMPSFAKYYRDIMPSSHYIDIHIKVANYGDGFLSMLAELSSFAGFLVLLPLVIFLINKYFLTLPIQETDNRIRNTASESKSKIENNL